MSMEIGSDTLKKASRMPLKWFKQITEILNLVFHANSIPKHQHCVKELQRLTSIPCKLNNYIIQIKTYITALIIIY